MIEIRGPNRFGEYEVRYTHIGEGYRAHSKSKVNALEFRYCGAIQGVLRVIRRCLKREGKVGPVG